MGTWSLGLRISGAPLFASTVDLPYDKDKLETLILHFHLSAHTGLFIDFGAQPSDAEMGSDSLPASCRSVAAS